MKNVDDTQLAAISKKMDLIAQKLDALIRLQVLKLAEGKNQTEQISLYSTAGLQPTAIAELLGTTPNTVRVILFNLRRARKMRHRR